MLKENIMSILLVIGLLAVLYLIIYKFTDLNPAEREIDIEVIPSLIKDEINNYFGTKTINEVTITSQGFGFEGLENEPSPRVTYIISASVITLETCVYIMIDDLTPTGLHLATNDLIQRILGLRKNLHLSC